MRVLVTGADGSIAGALVTVLRDLGHDVATTGRRPRAAPGHFVADLVAPEAAEEVTALAAPAVLVHLAGRTAGEPEALWRDNVLATESVARAATRLDPKPHLVLVGSAAEYGGGTGLIGEDSELRPVTEYGRTKMAATRLAASIAAEAAMALSVVRPFNIVSDAMPASTALGAFRDQLLAQHGRRRTIECGRLDVVRDFVSLSFVVEALAAIALNAWSGTFNVCSGRGLTLGEVLAAMAHVSDVELELRARPEVVGLPAADRVVGDPARLTRLGLAESHSALELAGLVLGGPGPSRR